MCLKPYYLVNHINIRQGLFPESNKNYITSLGWFFPLFMSSKLPILALTKFIAVEKEENTGINPPEEFF